ncbi:PREDICTED: crooked neck [Prunus dulcis]|uniref:PREDICTED: crooked neck n=1 Tax=Prunus dulcis TaxID=3755 RepID=A0A5E4G2E0_PRUDU|nr:PREDICTED: crooked neck [Prunus dulcis]
MASRCQFEIRQLNLEGTRKILGTAIGKSPKDKIFKKYIEIELNLGNFDRCRKLYEKYLHWSPENCYAWTKYAELEKSLCETERTRALKRKSDAADYEAESSDRSAAPGPGYTEVVTSPLQTPVSSKVGKANKTSRLTKCSRSGPQTPACNVGSPSGANLTPAGPCRFDSSLDPIRSVSPMKSADPITSALEAS